MSERVPIGRIDLPEGWEVSTEIRALEPARAGIAAPLSAKKSPERSRASITVSRYASTHQDAADTLNGLLESLAMHVSGLKRIDEGAIRFADGNEGHYAIVTYDVGAGRQVAQCHAFRLDQGTTSHLTATVEVFDVARISAELLPILRTFLPG